MQYEVVVGIYPQGTVESLEECTLLETNDLEEAKSLMESLMTFSLEEEEEEEE